MSSEFDILISVSPNPYVFKKPMSDRGRRLLSDLIKWGCNCATVLPGGAHQLMVDFTKLFDQLIYDDAVHKYLMEPYIKATLSKAPKKIETVLSHMMLKPLLDQEWVAENLKINKYKVGSISNGTPAEMYKWLVNNFLNIDFSESDLNRIAEMGRSFTVEQAKDSAKLITDPSKHTISYLYKVLTTSAKHNEIAKFKMQATTTAHNKKMSSLVDLENQATKKVEYKSSDNDWDIDRVFIDIVRKNK